MPGSSQLLLPGLFDIPPAQCDSARLARELPRLNHVLRYASVRGNRAFSIDAMLRRVLAAGEDFDAARSLPLAPAQAIDDSLPAEHALLVKAVHLQPGLHNALLVPISENAEETDQINIIINNLKDLFKVDCDISAITDDLFLMRLKEFAAPTHYPHYLSVLGKPANPFITQSRDNLRWYRLLNEMQMFMHQHEINQQRARDGRLAINSLWCWGGGELPPSPPRRQFWISDDATSRRFAARLGFDHGELGDLERVPAEAELAVIDLRLLQALKCAVDGSLDDLLVELETSLIAPLLARMQSGAGRLRLCGGSERDYELGARANLRFWRRPTSLGEHLQPDDET